MPNQGKSMFNNLNLLLDEISFKFANPKHIATSSSFAHTSHLNRWLILLQFYSFNAKLYKHIQLNGRPFKFTCLCKCIKTRRLKINLDQIDYNACMWFVVLVEHTVL